jgi:hypothetical protein
LIGSFVRGYNRSYPFVFIGEGWDPFLGIPNRIHVISCINTCRK